MPRRPISIAFERAELTIDVSNIIPQREISPDYRRCAKYKQIAKSIEVVGIIEALVVFPNHSGKFLLLDGHTRFDILRIRGASEVRCTISTDDEGYTYNKRINNIAPVAQHFMIIRALENGVSESRLAEALSVDVRNICKKRDLLDGICPEAVELLQNKDVALEVFSVLRKMKPVRQVEAVEHMIAGDTFSALFAKALLAVTRPEFLALPTRRPKVSATSRAAQEMLGKETDQLIRDLKAIEDSYGRDVLTLTVCRGYFKKILLNPRVDRYLSKQHPDIAEALRGAISDR
jgi:hypothetical protein